MTFSLCLLDCNFDLTNEIKGFQDFRLLKSGLNPYWRKRNFLSEMHFFENEARFARKLLCFTFSLFQTFWDTLYPN